MKWFVLSMLLVFAGSAEGEFNSGNDLFTKLQGCEKYKRGDESYGNYFDCGYSMGFIEGVSDTIEGTSLEKGICVQKGVTSGQLRDVAHLWLKNNPGKRSYSANSLVITAMRETWPCL